MGLIRFLLACSVVLVHLGGIGGFTMASGRVAVEAFFIISGFYMAMVIDQKYSRRSDFVRAFWTSRYLRLAPVWFTVLACTIAAIAFAGIDIKFAAPTASLIEAARTLPFGTALYLAACNLLMLFSDTIFLFGIDPATGSLFASSHAMAASIPAYTFLLIPQGWTIGTELAFYLLAPFILLRSTRFLVGLALASIALRGLAAWFGLTHDPFTYRFFPFELATFLVGALAYRWRDSAPARRLAPFGLKLTFGVALVIVLDRQVPSIAADLALLGLVAVSIPAIFATTRNWKLDGFIGELSYPIYLCHVLILSFGFGPVVSLAAVLAASLALVCFVELPVERLRARLFRATGGAPQRVAAPAVARTRTAAP